MNLEKEKLAPDSRCPKCGVGCEERARPPEIPVAEKLVICVECDALLVVNPDRTLREPTQAETDSLTIDECVRIGQTRRVFRRFRADRAQGLA